jgi:hypothetical protein
MGTAHNQYCVVNPWSFILVFEVAGLIFKPKARAGFDDHQFWEKTKIGFQRIPNFIP